ncbi:MAG: hypothetical protein K5945_07495 [Bacteroidaceae bacterium]|nr:hypothetical protein [Bacteroidaceae bacterium]
MKRILIPICIGALFCIAACTGQGDRLTHSSARRAAERYFTMLIDGHYDEYVDGLVGSDSMADDMRSQMTDLLAQFMAQQRVKRELLRVEATADSLLDSTAYVYLDILYGDSASEQVGMSLRFVGDRWRMQ